jgi:hypothetical protein
MYFCILQGFSLIALQMNPGGAASRWDQVDPERRGCQAIRL